MDLPDTCLVVPTYWTRQDESRRPGDAVYDHPTPVTGESTLPALLQSLEILKDAPFYLLVLVAVTGVDVAGEAEARVRQMVSETTSVTALVFGRSHLPTLHAQLAQLGHAGASEFLTLSLYPKIRNLQLALPLALGTQAIVAVDDDEIMVDPDFVRKATEPLGSRIEGATVDGLSGYYLQDDGGIMLHVDPQRASSSNIFDRKATIMNAATSMLESKPDTIVPTPFCFGGNMEFSAELAASVGFDPQITRGEDIDYLINARLEGKNFFLRRDLRILHCPPRGGSYKDASWSKLEQDAMRFVYEREKLRVASQTEYLHDVPLESLMPYPGEFLSSDIEQDAVQALREAGYPGDAEALLGEARNTAGEKVRSYLSFRATWPRVMDALRNDDAGRRRLIEVMQAG